MGCFWVDLAHFCYMFDRIKIQSKVKWSKKVYQKWKPLSWTDFILPSFCLTCVKTNRFTLEQHLFFRFISRVSVSLCQLSAAAAAFNGFPLSPSPSLSHPHSLCFCFIFHTIRNATHVRHAPNSCIQFWSRAATNCERFPLWSPQKAFLPIQMICDAVFMAHWRRRRRQRKEKPKINSKTSQLGFGSKDTSENLKSVNCSGRDC